ncbi:hypothetical protein [Palleronia pelagia]|uniref:DUF1127 domain-containing protein n=1 Tax=Palleronia pelagia TaxID=387096 RepID=A0A1H8HD89_9RHOB|nr:hypothetical protein [Palleronia pelagia]SEN54070.1 hypothetical protein SAMN04488011_104396 [Palleronia pelagia]
MTETLFHPARTSRRRGILAALLLGLVRWQASNDERARLANLTPEARRDMGLPPAPAPQPARPIEW